MSFFVTLTTVAVMLLYAVPGFLLVKGKLVKGDHISSFSKLLAYVCQPCLTVYSFRKLTFSAESLKNIGICLAITFFLQIGMLMLYFFLFRKKRQDIMWRVINLAAVLSHAGGAVAPVS